MPSRNTQKLGYTSDLLAQTFVRRVDDHFATQTALGYAVLAGGELPMPRTLRPRHAVGVDASGRRHAVVVADPASDLWTRAATTWSVLGDDGALATVTMTGLVGEAVTF